MMSSNQSIATCTTGSVSTVRQTYPKRIFLGISPITNEAQLWFHLQTNYGQVNQVHIPRNDHGANKGFAFVTFRWHEDAAAAIEDLDGRAFDGIILHPHWATTSRPRKQLQNKSNRNGSRSRRKQKAESLLGDKGGQSGEASSHKQLSG